MLVFSRSEELAYRQAERDQTFNSTLQTYNQNVRLNYKAHGTDTASSRAEAQRDDSMRELNNLEAGGKGEFNDLS